MNVCVLARTREEDTLAMLEAPAMPTPDTSAASESVNESVSESVLVSRQLIGRLQAEVKFERTRNEALNF